MGGVLYMLLFIGNQLLLLKHQHAHWLGLVVCSSSHGVCGVCLWCVCVWCVCAVCVCVVCVWCVCGVWCVYGVCLYGVCVVCVVFVCGVWGVCVMFV